MAEINRMDTEKNKATLQEVYVIALAENDGEFEWLYIHPKPYYLTEAEALEIRNSLIENEESVTESNCIVKKAIQSKTRKIITKINQKQNEKQKIATTGNDP